MRKLARVLIGVWLVLLSCALPNRVVPSPTREPAQRVLIEPDAGLTPIVDALNAAQKTVRLEMTGLNERSILDALKSARGRGVDVRVILGNDPAAQSDLLAANISVQPGNPAHPATRAKLILVDERVALILTFDLVRAVRAGMLTRDYGVSTTDPGEVGELVRVFDADWQRVAPALTQPRIVVTPQNARTRLLDLIDSARKMLDIQTEELHDAQILDDTIRAVQRGVIVRVLMSRAVSEKDPSAASQDRLKRAGAFVRFVKTPFIHANLIAVDNARAFVGSQNLTPAALDLNREVGIVVEDTTAVRALAATFESDWNVGK